MFGKLLCFISLSMCGGDKNSEKPNKEYKTEVSEKTNYNFYSLPTEVEEGVALEVESESEYDFDSYSGSLNNSETLTNTESTVVDGVEGWNEEKSKEAQRIARTDNAHGGYCAKGVANILLKMGYPVERGNAHDWDQSLPRKGWKKISCQPASCPSGTLLQYESNVHLGKPGRSTGGKKWGHVEIVTSTSSDGRKYCSDACRGNSGGTVPDNFSGAWVYEGEI
ncbi:MAG: hypothetical protein COB02_10275 [Candidatus Cloacimonadota bacterium]|nr:MAG: hypothetical protein COB02_10275 [Candidatus Cloacimonadota bacterium]